MPNPFVLNQGTPATTASGRSAAHSVGKKGEAGQTTVSWQERPRLSAQCTQFQGAHATPAVVGPLVLGISARNANPRGITTSSLGSLTGGAGFGGLLDLDCAGRVR